MTDGGQSWYIFDGKEKIATSKITERIVKVMEVKIYKDIYEGMEGK